VLGSCYVSLFGKGPTHLLHICFLNISLNMKRAGCSMGEYLLLLAAQCALLVYHESFRSPFGMSHSFYRVFLLWDGFSRAKTCDIMMWASVLLLSCMLSLFFRFIAYGTYHRETGNAFTSDDIKIRGMDCLGRCSVSVGRLDIRRE